MNSRFSRSFTAALFSLSMAVLMSGCQPAVKPESVEAPPGADISQLDNPPADPGVARLKWRVENRFALFDHLGTEVSPQARENCPSLAELDEQDPAPRYSAAWLNCYSRGGRGESLGAYEAITKVGSPFIKSNGKTINHGAWDPKGQQYHSEYLAPRALHRVWLGLTQANGDPVEGRCDWVVSGRGQVRSGACAGLTFAKVPSDFQVIVWRGSELLVASAEQRIERRVILALGDSFASGEGNPDIPTRWIPEEDMFHDREREFGIVTSRKNTAEWWDDRCHRSFWSAQMFAALRYAFEQHHAYTSYISYSCSGAEVYDGLLVPQSAPPGAPNVHGQSDVQNDASDETRSSRSQKLSQLSAAAVGLCEMSGEGSVDPDFRVEGLNPPGPPVSEEGIRVVGHRCQGGTVPDRVLLSVGGNDVGFAGVVAWSLLPRSKGTGRAKLSLIPLFRKRGAVCPDEYTFGDQATWGRCSDVPASHRIGEMLDRAYSDLARSMSALLPVFPADNLAITSYPNPLRRNSDNKLCSSPAERFASNWRLWKSRNAPNPQAAWDGFAYFPMAGIFNVDEWALNVTVGEADRVERSVIRPLQQAVAENARRLGWRAVTEQLPAFSEHGWCSMLTDGREAANSLLMPGIERDTAVAAIKASEWKPFAPRGRWIRTINDSVLTQSNERIGESYNGGFHPTAEGHYATGEALYNGIKGEH